MRRLCADMAMRLPPLQHISMDRVAISFSQARKRVAHGLCATLTPMRFEHGATVGVRNGRRYRVQRLVDEQGREMLYLLSFYLPRFMDLPFDEKITTVIHELWHISPRFDGDLRRMAGRCYAHSRSQKQYDTAMAQLARQYLSLAPPPYLYQFLKHDFDTLYHTFGGVYGSKCRQPKLIPLD